jgi:hypothetical protein
MIYTLNEYKEAAIVAERWEFAKRYAIADEDTAKRVLEIHRKFEENIENNDFLELLYEDYLRMEGLRYDR